MSKKYSILLGVVFYSFFLLLTPLGIFNDWVPPLTQTGYYSIAVIDSGDDTGYYAYLRSAFFDGDFDFLNEGNYAHIKKFTPTGYVFNNWQIGQSILFLPFFLAGHLVAVIYNSLGYAVSVDGYSAPYYMATAVASQTYLFAGLLLLFNILRKRFDGSIALVSTLAIWLGSPLLYYTFIRQRMAHTVEFFLAVVFIYFWLRERNSEDYFRHAILGSILGLLCMVRLLDIGFFALYLIDQIFLLKAKQDVSLSLKARTLLVRAASFGIFFILMFLPQLLTWNQLNGVPLPLRHVQFAGQGLTGFSLLPFLGKSYSMFFDVRWGLVLSAPLMVLGLVGVFIGNGVSKELRAGLGAYLLFLFLMIILYPEDSDSYGHRHLISTLPVLAWGLAGILDKCSRHSRLWVGVMVFVTLCVGAQYFMLIQYKVTMPYNDPEFVVKALGTIPSILFDRVELLLRSTNIVQLFLLDNPKNWNYRDTLFLIIFPLSQLIIVALVLFTCDSATRLRERWVREAGAGFFAGGVLLLSLVLVFFVVKLTPPKTEREISDRKIYFALTGKGEEVLSAGKVDEAILLFKEAARLMPKFWAPLYRIGTVYNQKKEFEEAIINYRRVLVYDPHHSMTLFTLGDTLVSLGKLEEAKFYLKESMRMYPSNKSVYNSLGQAYAKENNLEKAQEMFEIAVTLEPAFAEAHVNLALLWTLRNNSKEAVGHLKEVLRLGFWSPMVSKLSKLYKIEN